MITKKFLLIINFLFFLLTFSFAAIICPVCGKANPDGSKFCGYCGASLVQEVPSKQLPEKKEIEEVKIIKKETKVTNLVKGMAFLALGIYSFIYGFSKEDISKPDFEVTSLLLSDGEVNNYYYPEVEIELKNKGNTELKNFLIEVDYYNSAGNIIKTEYIAKEISISESDRETINIKSDTATQPSNVGVKVISYNYEKVYKTNSEVLGYLGLASTLIGTYYLYNYYKDTTANERLISRNNFDFKIFLSCNKIFLNFIFKML
jgi:hypothetical protein